MDIKTAITKSFTEAIEAAFPGVGGVVEVTQSQHGDYQCNSAMKLVKELKQNPRAIAEAIVEKFSSQMVESVDIAGPGFINVTLKQEAIEDAAQGMLDDPRLGVEKVEKPLKVVCEFSSPNTAKEMHVGHLRSTIIGETLSRLLEFLGHDVLRLNHVGDWGTQFGMLIAYIDEEGLSYDADLSDLMAWYKASKLRFDAEPAFKKRAQQRVVDLQGGDPDALAAWKKICEISRKAYQEIYDLLDVHLEERGESSYNAHLPEIVRELEEKGLVLVSEGAKCIFLEGFHNREGEPLPLMIQKSDGGYGYATTDMAAIKQRIFSEKADWLIYVIDAGQHTHMQQVFKAAEKAGWLGHVRADHVAFGLVLGSDGKKFRTRSGETEKLVDLLTEAVVRARKLAPDDEVAKVVGLGAVKYADLSCQRTGDYQFSYDRMLQFEGNTAAFLLYAYVRVAGIKRKVGVTSVEGKVELSHPTERALGLHLARFPEALHSTARDLMPHRLCEYLFKLAELFHAFFRDCRVEGSDQQESRLVLCEIVARVLKQGLAILGLKTVDRM